MSTPHRTLGNTEKERGSDEKRGQSLSLGPLEEQMESPRKEVPDEPRRVKGIMSKDELVSFFDPGSVAAEQFKKLRSHLFKMRLPRPPKTIMVTSATSGEGKTLVAVNLAATIVTAPNASALLVDCDFRNASLSKWFGVPEKKGLSDFLAEDGQHSEAIVPTEIGKLSFLPAGGVRERSSELIGSDKMETLVQMLRTRESAGFVIFDSTPLLATTEPEVLAKWVDGIILVVRAGVTPRETVEQAIKVVDKEKIIGVVLNDVDFRSSALHSRYFGSNSYYYMNGHSNGNGHPKGRSEKFVHWVRSIRRETPG